MYYIYTLFHLLALPFIFFRLYRRGKRNPGYRHHWLERFGKIPFRLNTCIWLHAVSLGESIGAKPLIQQLLQRYPKVPLVITNTTPTGRAFIEAHFGKQVYHAYVPYDIPCFLNRFFRQVKPQLLILMETELWPNLLKVAKKQHIPTLLANARLSERSYRGYRRFHFVTKTMLANLDQICAQYADDQDRFIRLGYPEPRIKAVGSIKFDIQIAPEIFEQAKKLQERWQPKRPCWIAASTHEGEEDIILTAHHQILAKEPQALLILVPRHPERFQKVANLCEQKGYQITRKSQSEAVVNSCPILIGDTMGELLIYYASAQIAFVGGSLKPVGGHNLLEPAALGVPTLTGPHYFNFQHITKSLLEAGFTQRVSNADTLAQAILNAFANPEVTRKKGLEAKAWVAQNQGATQRHLQIIEKFIML